MGNHELKSAKQLSHIFGLDGMSAMIWEAATAESLQPKLDLPAWDRCGPMYSGQHRAFPVFG